MIKLPASLRRTAIVLALSALPLLAQARQCDGDGQLQYLGVSNNNSHSIWLSNTGPGGYRLEAAQRNLTVDTWSKSESGLRLSISPVVSSGKGGTHKLYTSNNCFLGSQNQKGGFVFPPTTFRPPNYRPEVPLTPTVPTVPSLPGGVTPPIGTLPPETLTPMLPTKPNLPGTLPPETLTPMLPTVPSLPGGVTPPIGTLPPETLTPTRPTVPSLPGGVTPPIGTLPPETLTPTRPTMPSLPGGVTPPIGTLPPETLTPTRPTVPSLPGGVTPPIGTLPPETLTPTRPTMPSLPGGVTPPIGTLPPETLTPTVPGVQPPTAPNPEITVTPGGAGIAAAPISPTPCRGQRPDESDQAGQLSDCYAPATGLPAGELPMTAGRELVAKSEWNSWVDGSVSYLRDRRDGMDTDGDSGTLVIGLDRVLRDDLVAGVQVSFSRGSSDSFNETVQSDSTDYSVGPYMAYSLSESVLLYGSLTAGRTSVDTDIVSLSGTSEANHYALNLQVEGQYPAGPGFVRPKLDLSYTHTEGDTYPLKGTILNIPLTINMRNESFDYGVVQGSIEFNRTFDRGNKNLIMAFFEAGISYEFERPNSGEHLGRDLTYSDTSPWSGAVRAGVRSLFGTSTMTSLEIGNQTVGVNDLNIWALRLLVSHSF